MKRSNIFYGLSLGVIFTVVGFSCAKSNDEVPATSRKLYIATGVCYNGTGYAAPSIDDVGQLITRVDLDSRNYEIVRDYANLSQETAAGAYPNGMVDGGDGHIYVAVENTTDPGNRRIDKIVKTPFGAQTKIIQTQNPFIGSGSGIIRGVARTADKGYIFGNTTTFEHFDAGGARKVTPGALASWGAALQGPCAGNNTRITEIIALPKVTAGGPGEIGKIIYAHSAVGEHNIGIVGKNGSNATNCLFNSSTLPAALTEASTADPSFNESLSATATPTSIVFIPTGTGTGKLLVAYASSTGNQPQATANGLNNALVMYDFTESTTDPESASLSNGTVLFNGTAFFGVSAIAYDSATNSLYAATVKTPGLLPPDGFHIEKFTIDLTTPGATRVLDADNSSFENSNTFNNCVTSMFVGE